jgi:hypothetical protein
MFWQAVEAVNFNDAQWGTASAQPIVVEFWAFATFAGTYAVALQNWNGDRSFVSTFTLPASTWTKVRINVPGDTAGTWTTDPPVTLNFPLCVGATYSTATLNAWVAGGFYSATGAVNVLGAVSRNLSITGVALMVGAAAANAEPEFKKYSDNLIDCQRYFVNNIPAHVIASVTGVEYISASVNFPQQMRSSPTVTYVSDINAHTNCSTPGADSATVLGCRTLATSTATGNASFSSLFSADADF